MNDLINCPAKKCYGYYSTSKETKLIEHIKRMAMSELLDRYLFNTKNISHAVYLKKHLDKKETLRTRRYRNTAVILKALKKEQE